ncbi:MAG: DNA-binding protein, partial [Bacteroidales bacterium]|nr:DNA-binding protein [Bacteroidales bacterium]
EFVDALWIKTNKSLIKVDSVYNEVLPLEGGVFETYLITKGQGVSVEIPEDAKSWLSIQSIDQKGTDACVKFRAAENTGGDRETTIVFRTTDGKKDYTAQTTLKQKGAIVPLTIAEFNGKEVGNAVFRLTGLVTKVEDAAAGKYYISDYTGSTYVYKAANSANVKVGDVISLTGKHAEYKGNPQVGSGSLESIEASAEAISLADFNAAADDNNKFYVLTGKITKIANATYGNVNIEDETGANVYLYGCYGDWTGTNKKNFLGDNGIVVGDVITVVTIKTSHNDAPQGKNAVCFAVKKAE